MFHSRGLQASELKHLPLLHSEELWDLMEGKQIPPPSIRAFKQKEAPVSTAESCLLVTVVRKKPHVKFTPEMKNPK